MFAWPCDRLQHSAANRTAVIDTGIWKKGQYDDMLVISSKAKTVYNVDITRTLF